mmetsp:Transcript_28991/g.77375  ORF Transcript_28991/g.77375 Transcript_28991/m.77375 type:complete len:599 (-) Transcript_28991:33-1829(-)
MGRKTARARPRSPVHDLDQAAPAQAARRAAAPRGQAARLHPQHPQRRGGSSPVIFPFRRRERRGEAQMEPLYHNAGLVHVHTLGMLCSQQPAVTQGICSQHHPLERLVGHARQPAVVQCGVRALGLALLQQPVAVLHEDPVGVSDAQGAGYLRPDRGAPVQGAPVVGDDHAPLRPVEVVDEARVLAQSRPQPVCLHEGLVHGERQSADSALGLRLDDLLQAPAAVEDDYRVRVDQLERDAPRARVCRVAGGAVSGVELVAGAVRDVHRGQQLVGVRVLHPQVLCQGKAVGHLAAHVPLSLVEELQETRRALVHAVVGVHGQRVRMVVVPRVGLRHFLHESVPRAPDRVLVKPAEYLLAMSLERGTGVLHLQTLRGADPVHHGDAWADHRLIELHLRVQVRLQVPGVEGGDLDAAVPGGPPAEQAVHQTAGALDEPLAARPGVQGLPHEGRQRVEPLRLEDLGPGGARLHALVLDRQALAAALRLRAGDPEPAHAPHVRRRLAVVVGPRAGRGGVPQPRGVHLVARAVGKLHGQLPPAVDRLAVHDCVGLRAGTARDDLRRAARGRPHRACCRQAGGGSTEPSAATAQKGGHCSFARGR